VGKAAQGNRQEVGMKGKEEGAEITSCSSPRE